jgi:hypothetical protein
MQASWSPHTSFLEPAYKLLGARMQASWSQHTSFLEPVHKLLGVYTQASCSQCISFLESGYTFNFKASWRPYASFSWSPYTSRLLTHPTLVGHRQHLLPAGPTWSHHRQATARLEPLCDASHCATPGAPLPPAATAISAAIRLWNRGCAGATRTQGGVPGRARTPGDRFSQAAIAIRLFGGVPGLGPAAGTLARAAGPASLLPGQAVDGGQFSGRRTA